MSDYRFDFSIIIPVYNVQEYIGETMESLLNQTFPLERVQFIMVDDGSPDNSGAFCDAFKEKHPENTVVIHKENGGLSSARMAGIPYAEGKYVNFCDPDDMFSPDVLQKVFAFYQEHEGQTDVVAIPVYYFGDQEGPHPLNDKFEKGTRLIDLADPENYRVRHMFANSAFFTRSAVEMMDFDRVMVAGEDVREVTKILIEKMTIGVVDDGVRYEYRRRQTSILGGVRQKRGWYLPYLERYPKFALDYCTEKLGYVPRFIQSTVMYDLQVRFRMKSLIPGVLTPEEEETYRNLIYSITDRIDDDIILEQDGIQLENKLSILHHKYGRSPEIILDQETNRPILAYQGRKIHEADLLLTRIHEINLDARTRKASVVASQIVFPGVMEEPTFLMKVGGKLYPTTPVRLRKPILAMDKPVAQRVFFRGEFRIPTKLTRLTVRVAARYGDIDVTSASVTFDEFAPISRNLPNSYWLKDELLVQPLTNGFVIEKAPEKARKTMEKALYKSLKENDVPHARRIAFFRMLYFAVKRIAPTNLWLISDRINRADDNGEALFRYLCENKNKELYQPVFVIDKSSPAYGRLKKVGPVVPYLSWQHKLLHLLAENIISAYAHDTVASPFEDESIYFADLSQRGNVVFLQHGITQSDISVRLNRYKKNYKMFITTNQQEYDSILYGNYGYHEGQVVLTGMPRYDTLYDNAQKKITVMPSWRRSLVGNYSQETGCHELLDGFEQSAFYAFYNGLLNSQRLLEAAERMGYTLQFMPHPIMAPYSDRFQADPRVRLLDARSRYRDVFAESSLLLTDFSSVAFDFAYLKKPVVYAQFETNHYGDGYFDIPRDGFGEVTEELEETVDLLIDYMENDCKLKPAYQERIERFFAYTDRNNCSRVVQKILGMNKKPS